ncbi:uncharacterized protein LOC135682342 [Rhopilema esculentum]|uniref:uncharacterized protein LOC135682342 n=1 Tax=Rhopilema esculentum TaxID=499914 RepID=UPI0031D8C907
MKIMDEEETQKQEGFASSTSCEEESKRSTSNLPKTISMNEWNGPQCSQLPQNELQNMNELKDSMATMANMFKEFIKLNRRGNEAHVPRPKSGSTRKKRSWNDTNSSSSVSSSSEEGSKCSHSKRRRKNSSSSHLSQKSDHDNLQAPNGEDAGKVANKHGGEFLDNLNEELNEKDEEVDDPVSEKLANIIEKRWKKLIPGEKLKTLHSSYKRPSNCSQLIVPRVNRPVWMRMRKEQKDSDRRIAHIQENVIAATSALVQGTELVLNSNIKEDDMKQIAKKLVDSSALLGHVNRELSERRRAMIKPYLKQEYKDLCSEETQITKLIFGDEFNQQIADLKKSSSITNNPMRSNDSRYLYRGRNYEYKRSYSNYSRNHNNNYHNQNQSFLSRGQNTNFKKKTNYRDYNRRGKQ